MSNYDRELGDEKADNSDFGWTAPRHLTGMFYVRYFDSGCRVLMAYKI